MNQFSPSTFTWVPEVELRLVASLQRKRFDSLSNLTGPRYSIFYTAESKAKPLGLNAKSAAP